MASRKIALIIVPALIALVFRFTGLTFDSFWLDEGYQTIVGAYGHGLPDFQRLPERPFLYKPAPPASSGAMLANFRAVDPLTPPLYQLILNRWIKLWGGSDFAVRSLSALISFLTVAALTAIAYLTLGWRAALFAALLQAVSPFDVYYGQEARMYALEQLMAVLSMGGLGLYLFPEACRFFKRPISLRLLLLLYCLSTWALINTHYTGLFLFAAEIVLAVFIAIRRRSVVLLVWFAAACVLVGVLWLPWLPMFFQAASIRTAAFYVARQPSWTWPLLALFDKLPSNWVMFLSGNHVVTPALPLFLTSAVILLIAFGSCLAPNTVSPQNGAGDQPDQKIRLWLLWWAIAPALILWALDVFENHRVIEMPRYLISTAPAIYMLCGAGLSWLAARRPRAAIILLAAQLVFAGINDIAHAAFVHQREPWKQMARTVEQTVPPSEPILVSQFYDLVCLDRYLTHPYRQVGVSSITSGARLAQLLDGTERFALVTAQEGDRVIKAIPPNYKLDSQRDLGHSLHLLFFSKVR